MAKKKKDVQAEEAPEPKKLPPLGEAQHRMAAEAAKKKEKKNG